MPKASMYSWSLDRKIGCETLILSAASGNPKKLNAELVRCKVCFVNAVPNIIVLLFKLFEPQLGLYLHIWSFVIKFIFKTHL